MDPWKLMMAAQQYDGADDGGGGGDDGGGDDGDGGVGKPPPLFRPSKPPPGLPGAADDEPDDDDEPEDDKRKPAQATIDDLQRRDAELVEAKRKLAAERAQLQRWQQAEQFLKSGKRNEALQALGLDRRELLADEWGEDLLPPREPPKPEQQIEQLGKAQQSSAQEIADLRTQLAYSEISRDIRDELDAAPELEMMKLMATKGRGVFYRGMVDRMIAHHRSEGEWPSAKKMLADAENEYLDKWAVDASDLLKIEKVRKKLGVDFIRGAKKETKPPAAAARQQQRRRLEPESATSLLNDMQDEPPVQKPPKAKLTRAERRELAIARLAKSRAEAEQNEEP